MEHSCVQLMDLPDEIIIMILKKLENVEVLYSFMGINTRLNQIVHDPIFTTKITIRILIFPTSILPSEVLDRFCCQILPKIHHKIEWLNIESIYIDRVLLSGVYPNLRQLGIFIRDTEPFQQLTGTKSYFNFFNHQLIKGY